MAFLSLLGVPKQLLQDGMVFGTSSPDILLNAHTSRCMAAPNLLLLSWRVVGANSKNISISQDAHLPFSLPTGDSVAGSPL